MTIASAGNTRLSEEFPLSQAGDALRMLAAQPRCREAFTAEDSALRDLLAPMSRRYVVADEQSLLFERLRMLRDKSYRVSVEYVGEENTDEAEIEAVVQEYLSLIHASAEPVQLGFDLSNLGLLVSKDLAAGNTARILRAAAAQGGAVVLSMERSELVDDVLEIFARLAAEHENVGITMQASLHRTEDDLARIVRLHRKIRLVKGAFPETADIALPRGAELDRKYLHLAEYAVGHGARLTLATHDSKVLDAAADSALLSKVEEIEMLHGVRPCLLRGYRDAGVPCRVYATYGRNWWLHLLHRLAEHPPMVMTALADLADPSRVVFGADY